MVRGVHSHDVGTWINSTSSHIVHLLDAGGGGGGSLAGRYKESRAGRYKIFLMLGGGEGGGRTGKDVTHWSFYTFIRHKRVSPRQQFSALQDADCISSALNNTLYKATLI
jgi:hypothetical protein